MSRSTRGIRGTKGTLQRSLRSLRLAAVVGALLASLLAIVAPTAAIAAPGDLLVGDGLLVSGLPGADAPATGSGSIQLHTDDAREAVIDHADADFSDGSTTPGATGSAVAVGDFDNDGIYDLVAGSPDDEAIRVVMGSATGGFDTATTDRITQADSGLGLVEAGDEFGAVIVVGDFDNDDYDDIAVSAPGEDIGAIADAGGVLIFFGSASGISTLGAQALGQAGPVAGAPESGDRFGTALAVGDFDGDNFDDLAIGVPNEDLGPIADAGLVHILYGSSSGLVAGADYFTQNPVAVPTALRGAPEAGDRFAAALAAGDFDNDGRDDLAIGVPGEDIGAIVDAGVVNLTDGTNSGLVANANVIAQRGPVPGVSEAGDEFGASLAAGLFDNGNRADLVVGAPGESVGSLVAAGAVSVVHGSAAGLNEADSDTFSQSGAVAGSPEAGDRFGYALAAGDLDGDGLDDVAIGVPFEDGGTEADSGAVNVLFGAPASLSIAGDRAFSQGGGSGSAGDRFGFAVAIVPDDGSPDLDLSISLDDDADPVKPGDTVEYTMTVQGNGPDTANDAVAVLTIPNGMTVVDPDICVESPLRVLSCSLSTIGTGSQTFVVDVTVDSGSLGTLGASASVTSSVNDPDTANNTATEDTLVVALGADLSVTKVDDVDPVNPGDTVVYTIEVSNAGPDAATNVVATDVLPSGVTLVSTSGCAEDPNGVATCSLGTIGAGSSKSYTATVTINGGTLGQITNSVSVVSAVDDPTPGNNSTTETTTVAAPSADLSVTIDDSADPVAPGDGITYSIEVSNAGPNNTSSVIAFNALPANVTLVSTSGCAEDPVGGSTCSLGSIASGASKSYTISVTVDSGFGGGTLTDAISVLSALNDPVSSNNFASETTVVQVAPAAVADANASGSVPGDDFHTAVDTTLTSGSSERLLANDAVGSPAATLTAFGGGSLGGVVTDNAAGATVTTGGISLNVASDGSFVFTPASGFSGIFTFSYRLANAAGASDTTVTIAVGGATATNDSYGVAGNVGIDVPAGSGVLVNDSSGTVTAFDAASAQGGTVNVASDGSFTYDPPVGFAGSDSFGYTMTGAVGTASASVTLTVSDVYWFIDNEAVAAGDGTLGTPFNSLAAFEALNGNGGAADPAAGDIIVLDAGDAIYTGGVTLENNQILVGEGSTASIATVVGSALPAHSNALPSTGGANPIISDITGSALALGSQNTVRGLHVSATGAAIGVSGSGVGTLTISEVSVGAQSGRALDIDNGIMLITLDAVSVTSGTSGGIDLTNIATGSTVNLSGVAITASAGTGMNIGGLGVVNITGTNSIVNTGGRALSISGTDIGSSGVTFSTLSSSNTTNALHLANTGSGAFTATGGSISSITGDAVTLSNTNGPVTLSNMFFTDIGTTAGGFHTVSTHDAIHGENVLGGLSLTNITADNISDNFVNGSTLAANAATNFVGLTVAGSSISDTNRFHVAGVGDSTNEGAIRVLGLSGTVSITGNDFDRSASFLDISSATVGTLAMTVTGNTFTDGHQEYTSGGTASVGRICVDVLLNGSLTSTITIGGAGALGNTFANCKLASIRMATVSSSVTGSATVSILDNDFLVTDHSSTLGLSGDFPQGGVQLQHEGTGAFDALVENNNFGRWTGSATADWLMNANGSVGALSVLANAGITEVEVANNAFNSPINSPFFVRANGAGATANLHFHDNTYRSQFDNFSPDPFFGSFTAPGIQHDIIGQSGAVLNLTAANEAIAAHDTSFDFQDTFELTASGGATVCGSFTNVTTAVTGTHGDIRLTNSSSTLNRHDGGGNDPFEVSGTIGTASSCTLPSGPLF